MWKPSMMASKGVQQVAETGNSSVLQSEIMMRMMYNKTVWKLIQQQSGAIKGMDMVHNIAVEVTADYPMVSLISMIFPSPDWFIGIDSHNLCNNGMWRDTWNVPMLSPWDAGTDNGMTFNANDAATTPQGNIAIIDKMSDTPFKGANDIPTMGTLMFKRVNKPMKYMCSGEQKYKVKFEGMWTMARHPAGFPSNAHFSPLIGCTHMYNYKFWSPMTMASQGVQEVAEGGDPKTLYTELKNVMQKGRYIYQVYKADKMMGGSENTTMEIMVKGMYTQASFVSMIAPSPDWFVGVDGVELCGSDGKWKNSVTMPLQAWDAGTDSGMNFTSPNMATMPRDVITIITKDSNTVLKGANAIADFAKITFTKYTPMMTTPKPSSAPQSASAGVFSLLSMALIATVRFLY